MAQQFSYDEKGSTFLYFLLSFFAMILIPLSYLMWPKTLKEEEKQVWNQRDIHGKSKWFKRKQEELRRRKSKPSIRKVILVLGWVGFLWLVYKVSTIENDHIEYNPYEVLGVSEDADKTELKKVYRQLSKENHPDKGGDPDTFMRIRKAYEALTDEETMQNWREYGNPDGPQAMEFGIALPKWIVESQNSFVVLSVYMFLFMIALPLVVGIWWNRSIKYSKEQVLLDTTQLYFFFINKTPNMNLKRALMVFSGSFEFSHDHNTQVRPPSREDNEDIPELISELEHDFNITENAKDRPFNFPYSVKARVLIYSHLCRLEITSAVIQKDIDYVLRKSPLLIQEMVNCIAQLTTMAHWNKANLPRLETLENVMKLAPMMVQGLRETKSSLLQLPYFNEEFVKYCVQHKRQSVRGLRSLVELRESDRRQMLRRMGDEEYETMLTVLRSFPLIDLDVTIQVIDDEETHVITAGAIVTVTVSMKRRCFGDLQELDASPEAEVLDEDDQETQDKQPKLKVWEKQGKKKKNLKKKKPVKAAKKPVKKADKKPEENGGVVQEVPLQNKDDADVSGSDCEKSGADSDSEPNDEKDDREWHAMQATFRRKEKVALEVKDRVTHTVYAPLMPVEKQEWWWLYVCDRKKHLLLTSPVLITNLREEEETELKFPAPTKPGHYTYTVWLRSDSYFECDQKYDMKLDVKEAKPIVEDHPQWDISGDEGKDGSDDSEDEGISSEEQSSSEE